MRSSRRGNLVWIALGCLMIASIGAFMLATVSQSNLRLTGLLKAETELRWTAHAAISTFANRLKMASWDHRFYAPSAGASEYADTLTYRGRSVSLWATDSVRAGVVATGTTDVFARVEDSDLVLGTYARLRLTSNPTTNPRVLHVLKETTVREDFQRKETRERFLKAKEEEEKAESLNGPEGDVYGRAIERFAEKDGPPDRIGATAIGVAGEVPVEKRFHEILAKTQTSLRSGNLIEAISSLDRAMEIASGSGSPQSEQRRMVCELMMARAQYALGLASAEPERTKALARSSSVLDKLIQDLGPGCVGPTAAYLRAQVRMVQSSSKPGISRSQAKEEASRELKETLSAIAAGASFEGGSVFPGELVDQFVNSWSLSVAFTDYRSKRDSEGVPGPNERVVRVSLTTEDGTAVSPLPFYGLQVTPLIWLPNGSGLLVDRLDSTRPSSGVVTLVDRAGNVIQEFEDLKPSPSIESGGFMLTPKGDQIVFYGVVKDEQTGCFWGQDLKGGAPRRILGPGKDDLLTFHDSIKFSRDGKLVSYPDPEGGGVKIADTAAFLQGAPAGKSVFPLSAEMFTPGMAWVKPGARGKADLLVVFAAALDDKHPEWGHLMLVDPTTGTVSRSPSFPKDFAPSVVIPHQGRTRLTLLPVSQQDKMSQSPQDKRYLTLDYGSNGFAPAFEEKTFANDIVPRRVGRGAGDVIYLSGGMDDPGLFRWDVEKGEPVRLPIPVEDDPSWYHDLTDPVVQGETVSGR